MNNLYNFIYRGVLTDESLDKAGRQARASFGPADAERVKTALSFELLDAEQLASAERMAIIYSAIHAFENSVRHFVAAGMAEMYEEEWWSKVPTKVQSKVKQRIEDEARFRWHGARGGSDIEYCDFGDLSSIIVNNWTVFEDLLNDMEWTKSTLSVLGRSRNIIMHGGILARQDIERIGINIRDWIRQVG
ncbi:MAG: hypothetical protein IID08_09350 [Candidatus Hydrogenedentes bacterium]|nr:hypothetical protein [Candidatus Hydrogenedentota bacterium]